MDSAPVRTLSRRHGRETPYKRCYAKTRSLLCDSAFGPVLLQLALDISAGHHRIEIQIQ